jgi:hypothetical protein
MRKHVTSYPKRSRCQNSGPNLLRKLSYERGRLSLLQSLFHQWLSRPDPYHALEIGASLGHISRLLKHYSHSLDLLEADPQRANYPRETFASDPKVAIFEGLDPDAGISRGPYDHIAALRSTETRAEPLGFSSLDSRRPKGPRLTHPLDP